VLAWYLWSHRAEIVGKNILELGAGTSLPGVTGWYINLFNILQYFYVLLYFVAAKCGAALVTLSDCARFTKCLENCRISAAANGVTDKVSNKIL